MRSTFYTRCCLPIILSILSSKFSKLISDLNISDIPSKIKFPKENNLSNPSAPKDEPTEFHVYNVAMKSGEKMNNN